MERSESGWRPISGIWRPGWRGWRPGWRVWIPGITRKRGLANMGDPGVQELGKRSQAGDQVGDLAPGWGSFGEACRPGIAQDRPKPAKAGNPENPRIQEKKVATGDYRGLPDQNFTENDPFCSPRNRKRIQKSGKMPNPPLICAKNCSKGS